MISRRLPSAPRPMVTIAAAAAFLAASATLSAARAADSPSPPEGARGVGTPDVAPAAAVVRTAGWYYGWYGYPAYRWYRTPIYGPWPCYAPGPCGGYLWRDEARHEREEALRREPATPSAASPQAEMWEGGGIWGYVRRIPPPTAEAEIRPEYRDSSLVRPEFAGYGERRDRQ